MEIGENSKSGIIIVVKRLLESGPQGGYMEEVEVHGMMSDQELPSHIIWPKIYTQSLQIVVKEPPHCTWPGK